MWTRGWLAWQTRPCAWPIWPLVMPLVFDGPLAGVKLPCLDGQHYNWMTSHIHGVGRTTSQPLWYFVTSVTTATTETILLSPAAHVCMIGHGFLSLVRVQLPCEVRPT